VDEEAEAALSISKAVAAMAGEPRSSDESSTSIRVPTRPDPTLPTIAEGR
jgi:hypothetical protein